VVASNRRWDGVDMSQRLFFGGAFAVLFTLLSRD
jgi:hypothetical protein